MRWIPLIALAACAVAEEPPFLRLSWQAGDHLAPGEPVATWWSGTLAATSAAWERSLQIAAPQLPEAAEVIGDAVGEGATRRPVVAIRWRGELGPAARAVSDAVAAWPVAYRFVSDATTATLRADGIAEPAATAAPPGWRLTLAGARVIDEVRELLGEQPPGVRDAVLAWLSTARIEAAVVPGEPEPTGWVDTGTATVGLRAVEADLLARVPDDAAAVVAIGVDAEALPGRIAALSELPDALPLPAPELARGAGGTWLAAWCGEGRFIVRIPRSPATDRLIAATLDRVDGVLPADDRPLRIHDAIVIAHDTREWLIADDEARVAAWRSAGATGAVWAKLGGTPPGGAALIAACTASATPTLLAELDPEAVRQWPLDVLSPRGKALMLDLGVRPPQRPDWRHAAEALHVTSPSRATALAGTATLRLDTSGPLLPWIPIGWALGWVGAQIQDQQGMVHLRQELAARQARGQAAVPADLLSGPPLAAEATAATRTALAATTTHDPATTAWKHLIETGRPQVGTEVAAEVTETIAAIDAATKPLDTIDGAIDGATLRRLLLADAAARGEVGPAATGARMTMTRKLPTAGQAAVAGGDATGLAMLDRALRVCDRPASIIELLVRTSCVDGRDSAYALAAALAIASPQSVTAWLDERDADRWVEALDGESALTYGWFAQRWLGGAAVGRNLDRDARSPAILMDRSMRAATAEDLVRLMRFHDGLARGGADVGAPLRELDSPVAGMLLPAVSLPRAGVRVSHLRGALLRLAVRALSRAPAGFASQDAAVAALGPLQVDVDGATIALRYERQPRSFTLLVDQTRRPPSWPERAWTDLLSDKRDDHAHPVHLPSKKAMWVTLPISAAETPAQP